MLRGLDSPTRLDATHGHQVSTLGFGFGDFAPLGLRLQNGPAFRVWVLECRAWVYV